MITRRGFLGGALAAAGTRVFAIGTAGGHPAIRFGVLSDVHISNPRSGNKETLVKALSYFRDRGADAVVIAGDFSDEGLVGQVRLAGEAWDEVFPGDRAPDGRRVEKVFIIGNHEHNGAPRTLKRILAGKGRGDPFYEKGEFMFRDFPRYWPEIFHEPWREQYMKEIRGYRFFASHWAPEESCPDVADIVEPGLVGYDAAMPFFHVQHPHPFGTVIGHQAYGTWQGKSATAVLSRHPNAVSFSGHSHRSLTDGRTLWQGAFTAIGTATLRRVSVGGEEENAQSKKKGGDRLMPVMEGATLGRQGQFVEVYDDRIVVERREFTYGDSLGPDRVIPWPPREKPFAFETQAARASAPRFAADAKVVVSEPFDGRNRAGRAVRMVKVTFPAAKSGGLAYDYELTARTPDGRVAKRRVLQDRFFLAPGRWPAANVCNFKAEEIPSGTKVTVVARNCFGKCGPSIGK